jgi:hypothetical protein
VSLANGDILKIIRVLNYVMLFWFYRKMYVVVAAWSKAWVFGRSLAGIAGSNLALGKYVCLLCCVYFQIAFCTTGRSLVQRIPTERGVSECDPQTSRTGSSMDLLAVKKIACLTEECNYLRY